MDYQEALDIATDALIELKNHRVDVLAVTKPSDIQGAIELSKIISKLSPLGSDAKQYRPDREYQILLRQLIGRFPYRLDTNFGKMDRIVLSSLESFKTKVLTSPYYGRTILSWVKAIKLIDSKALAPLIDPTEPPPIH